MVPSSRSSYPFFLNREARMSAGYCRFGAIGTIEIATVRDVKDCLAAVSGRGDACQTPNAYAENSLRLCQEAFNAIIKNIQPTTLAPDAIARRILFIAFACVGSIQLNMKPTFQPPSAIVTHPFVVCALAGIVPQKFWQNWKVLHRILRTFRVG